VAHFNLAVAHFNLALAYLNLDLLLAYLYFLLVPLALTHFNLALPGCISPFPFVKVSILLSNGVISLCCLHNLALLLAYLTFP